MSGPTQTLLLQSQKMLASTVQFSTYDQPPVTRPRQTPTPPQGARRYDRRTALTQEDVPARFPGRARSLRTQQRAYDRFPATTRVPHPEGPY